MVAQALSAHNRRAMSTPSTAAADWQTPFEIILLGAIWGASFLFQRVAAPEIGALPLAAVRVGLGTLVLLPAVWPVRHSLRLALLPRIALIGLLNSALPFLLFAWGARHAPAGVMAITNSLTPLFAAPVAVVFFSEPVGWRRALALLVGFAGVVLLAWDKAAGAQVDLAVLAGCVAALCYGLAVNLLRGPVAAVPPVAIAGSSLAVSALVLLPFAVANWPVAPVSTGAWVSSALLGVLCSGIAFGLYYRLLQRVGTTRAVLTTYLVPLFGVFWAWLLLGEAPTLIMLAAGALILGSVVFGQRR
jgi:drug/metabolite transporter (DMT)-like permease